jgi:clan AA aspartic protease (TIGR02281 family)
MGKPELAIGEWDKVLEKQPDYAWGYYRRGWFKELSGLYEGAIEDLSIAIVLEPTYTYSYSSRGDVYMKIGKRDLAAADFNKIIEIEDSPEKYECIQYAYQGLGQYDKAMEVMDKIIERDTTDAGSYYDAACVYCRMGKTREALDFFAKSLELGYKRFSHIEKDDDLDPIRNTDVFKRLIEKYKTKSQLSEQASTKIREGSTLEIPFVKENGVYRVECEINGLPLHFVLDTGASDVTLSLIEANFMMKNGYLSDKDVIGNQRYIDANGDISVGTVINIKGVSLGNVELCNVRATVVKNQRAPLLLGQSVLGRLGKIEIDNPNRILKITHTGDIEKNEKCC